MTTKNSTTATESMGTLRTALHAAKAEMARLEAIDVDTLPAVAIAYAAYQAAPEGSDASEYAAYSAAYDAADAAVQAQFAAAEQAVEQLRKALAASDEEREWTLREEGQEYNTVLASSAEEALETARANVDRSNYSEAEGTIWIDVRVDCEETGESDSCTVTLDEDEPECSASEHDWQSPHELLGGLEENPGVQGNGGGVIVREVCMHCGCERTTNTWAQNPTNGEQGLTSVSYEAGKYASEVQVPDEVAGYEVTTTATGAHRVSVDAECADEAIEAIRAALPPYWAADFAGEGNTDADGSSTEDIFISREF